MSLKQKLVNGQKAIPYDQAETVGVYYAAEKTRTFMDKEIYEQISSLPFEGRSCPALTQFDAYLTKLYGNYMQLPPVEKRVSHHAYDTFIEIE